MKKAFQLFQLCSIIVLMSFILVFSPQIVHAESAAAITAPHANVVNCPSPPANFNPLLASDAEIRYYGFPRRPQGNASELSDWLNLVNGAKYRSCSFINSHRYSQPLNLKSLSRPLYSSGYTYSVNWSGYFAGSGSGNGFKQVEGNWNVPCYDGSHSPSKSRAVTWIGLGGWYGNNLWQGGTTEDPSTGYHFWFEPFPQTYMMIQSQSLSCGDHIQAEVDYNVTVPGKSYNISER